MTGADTNPFHDPTRKQGMKRFRKVWCWLFGCRMVPVAYHRDGYGMPTGCTVYCFRCDTFGGCDL